MFAWFLRLVFIGFMAAMVYAWAPEIIDNYRATEQGLHGTVLVDTCDHDGCRGTFGPDDGSVHLTDLDVKNGSAEYLAGPGRTVEGWVTGPDASKVYLSRFWFPQSAATTQLLLLFSLPLLLLTPDRPARSVAAQAAVRDAADRHDLGVARGSIRWTKYLYLLPGLFFLEGSLWSALLYVWLPSSRPSNTVGLVGTGLWVAFSFAVGAMALVTTAQGVGRRLHLFERGIVVSRGRRCRVYRYADVLCITVSRSAARDNDPPEPYSVLLRTGDGRRLRVNHRQAIPNILSEVGDRISPV